MSQVTPSPMPDPAREGSTIDVDERSRTLSTGEVMGPQARQAWPELDGGLELTRPLPVLARRRIGASELTVFPVALGAGVFGGTVGDEQAFRILDRFIALGGNMVDTADSYAAGRSETLLGTWMHGRRNRESLVIATKIGRHADNPGLGQVSMVRAVESSLERLRTDHIDVLYFHGEDDTVQLEDSLATAEWLIESGKVRNIAAADFSTDRLIEARILSSTGLPQFIALQTKYNLLDRSGFESDLQMLSTAQALSVMPHTSLAGGFLGGGYRGRDDLSRSTRPWSIAELLGRRGHRVLAALDRVADEIAASPATVALAWLLAKRGVVAPVASVSAPEQLTALTKAASTRLTRAQMLELDRVSE